MALLLTEAIMLNTSCKKKNTAKSQVCKIQRVTSGTESYIFSYDDQFRIWKIESPTRTVNYSYNGLQYTILTTSSGSFMNKQIGTTNDAGLLLNLKTENNASGSEWTNDALNYNGTQVSSVVSTYSNGDPSKTTNYIWSPDGNLASIVPPSGPAATLSYYTDQPFKEGDYINVLMTLQFGNNYIRNKNLVKSLSSTNITYTFDADQKVSAFNIDTSLIKLEYTCR